VSEEMRMNMLWATKQEEINRLEQLNDALIAEKKGITEVAMAEIERLKEKITMLEGDKVILLRALEIQSEISAAERARNTQ
jgi:hypothetical protein